MAENSQGIDNPARRKLFKNIPKYAAATALAGFIGNEIIFDNELAQTGKFETSKAVWHPLYERHDEHEQVLSPENIPLNTDAISLEGTVTSYGLENNQMVTYNNLQNNPAGALTSFIQGLDTTPNSNNFLIPPDTLKFLRSKNIPVAIGDVNYTPDFMSFEYGKKMQEIMDLREKIGETMINAAIDAGVLSLSINLKSMTRRDFLKKLALGLTGAGVLSAAPPALRVEIHNQLMQAIKDNNPYIRIWARLHTIDSNLMPEYLNDMFREIVQANKLMTLADNLKAPGKNKPDIAYDWHYGHRGIEDWLRVGPNLTRSALLAYPDSVLKQVISANNNDPRSLYGMRLLQVPSSLKILDYNKKDGTLSFTYDQKEQVSDQIFKDKILANRLSERKIS